MLAKLMAFLKCQFAILAGLLEQILEVLIKGDHPEHTNIVKVNEVCVKGDAGAVTASVWTVWDQHANASVGVVYFDELGVQIGTIAVPPTVISDCECIDAIECCPEAAANKEAATKEAATKG